MPFWVVQRVADRAKADSNERELRSPLHRVITGVIER
jgi:hypothetical protein